MIHRAYECVNHQLSFSNYQSSAVDDHLSPIPVFGITNKYAASSFDTTPQSISAPLPPPPPQPLPDLLPVNVIANVTAAAAAATTAASSTVGDPVLIPTSAYYSDVPNEVST